MKRVLLIIDLLGLLAVACGSGATTNENAKVKPDPVDPVDEVTAGDPTESTIEGPATSTSTTTSTPVLLSPLDALMTTLSQAGESASFRFTTAVGTRWITPRLGISIDSPIDPDRPALHGTVVDGASHYVQDLGLLFRGLAGAGAPGVQEAMDAAVLEMWTTAGRLVMDTSGYQPLADLDPTDDFGPFAPGVWFVDLAGFVELGREEVVAVLVAQFGPRELAQTEQLFAGTDYTIETVTGYEFGTSITLPAVP